MCSLSLQHEAERRQQTEEKFINLEHRVQELGKLNYLNSIHDKMLSQNTLNDYPKWGLDVCHPRGFMPVIPKGALMSVIPKGV